MGVSLPPIIIVSVKHGCISKISEFSKILPFSISVMRVLFHFNVPHFSCFFDHEISIDFAVLSNSKNRGMKQRNNLREEPVFYSNRELFVKLVHESQ